MTIFTFANNINTTLASGISNSATSLTLASTFGLPSSIPAGEVLAITLNDAATRGVFEVIYAQSISGATLSGLIRGQEGTSALAWLTGDYAYSGPTAGQMAEAGQLGGTQTWTGSNTFTNAVSVGNAATSGQAINLGQAQADFAAINGNSGESFAGNIFLVYGAVQNGTGAVLLFESNSYTASVTVGNTAYIEHYCAPATIGVAAVTLSQFPSGLSLSGFKKYPDLGSPSGYFIEQWGVASIPANGSGPDITNITLPITYPNVQLWTLANFYGTSPPPTGNVAATADGANIISLTANAPASGPYGVSWYSKGY